MSMNEPLVHVELSWIDEDAVTAESITQLMSRDCKIDLFVKSAHKQSVSSPYRLC
jgi:hypothetical protein